MGPALQLLTKGPFGQQSSSGRQGQKGSNVFYVFSENGMFNKIFKNGIKHYYVCRFKFKVIRLIIESLLIIMLLWHTPQNNYYQFKVKLILLIIKSLLSIMLFASLWHKVK